MSNEERFLSLCSQIKRDGIEDLISWLKNSDFFYCPASAKYHGSHPGGLLEHSLNVYDELCRLSSVYPEVSISEDSKIIMALFHDLCKVNLYATEKRNRKNASGAWESYDASIATVNQNGKITAVGVGKTTIAAEAEDGSGIVSTINVTVTAEEVKVEEKKAEEKKKELESRRQKEDRYNIK